MNAKHKRRLARDAGVTLVEMMVVIVIIGLIAAVVAINVLPAQDTARIGKSKADLGAIEQALEMYRLSNGRYPTMEEGLSALTQRATGPNVTQTEPFLRRLSNDPWGRAYIYVQPGQDGRPFDLYSLGADGRDGGEGVNADITTAQ
jgi:general secretion pathway protein G